MDMAQATGKSKSFVARLEKSPTGMKGLDEITDGGLPKGRPTLVCGAAGCGRLSLPWSFL
jgi:circadian clock protein KaiC